MAISTAVQANAVARVIGIKTEFKDLREGSIINLPQRVAVIAQGNSASTYSLDKNQVLSRKEAGDLYGYGSPIERIVNQLFPVNGDGVGIIPVTIYPLEDAVAATPSVGSIDAAGVQLTSETYITKVNNIATNQFAIAADDTADESLAKVKNAIDAIIEMPITTGAVAAGALPVTAKWEGETGNDIVIEIEGEVSGIVFSITQPINGAANPNVQDSLDKIGNVWETIVVSGFNYEDDANLNTYEFFGDGRWGAITKKPLVVLTGTNEADEDILSAITDLRKADRTNVIFPAPGSSELPFVIAARAVARIAVLANDIPPHDYAGQRLTGLEAGLDSDQWEFIVRNDAVIKGLSTTELIDGQIEMSDTVTNYHPDGETVPAYRYVVDIMKIMNIIFNTELIFAADDWKGAPLLSNDTPTTEPSAKKPKDAVTEVSVLIDQLASAAIISEPDFAKDSLDAGISGTNPKRLDVAYTVKLSGNTNIISIDLNFGFFYGI